MKFASICFAAVIGLLLVAFCMVMSSKNGAICLEEVNTAIAAIDYHLTTRFNKLHELAACVKKYDKHESETLIKFIEAQNTDCLCSL